MANTSNNGFVPPTGARAAARRGLNLIGEGKAGKGFEPATAQRARKISAGSPLTRDHVMRMHSFFSRHAVDKKLGWGTRGKETPGYVAHQAWGGDAGKAWAASMAARIRREDNRV